MDGFAAVTGGTSFRQAQRPGVSAQRPGVGSTTGAQARRRGPVSRTGVRLNDRAVGSTTGAGQAQGVCSIVIGVSLSIGVVRTSTGEPGAPRLARSTNEREGDRARLAAGNADRDRLRLPALLDAAAVESAPVARARVAAGDLTADGGEEQHVLDDGVARHPEARPRSAGRSCSARRRHGRGQGDRRRDGRAAASPACRCRPSRSPRWRGSSRACCSRSR